MTVQSVVSKPDGSFALVVRAAGNADDLQLLLQPCRIMRVFGRLDTAVIDPRSHAVAIAALEQAQRTGVEVGFGWTGSGFKSVSKNQPCTSRSVGLAVFQSGERRQIMASARDRPAVRIAIRP